MTFSVDTNGTVTVGSDIGVSGQLGPVGVGASVSYERELLGHCNDAILLLERPVKGRGNMVTAYRLPSDQAISWATCGQQRSTWDPTKNALYVALGRGAKISLVGGERTPKAPRCSTPPPPRGTTSSKRAPSTSAMSTPDATSTPGPTPSSPSVGPTSTQPPAPELPSGRPTEVLIPDASADVTVLPRAGR